MDYITEINTLKSKINNLKNEKIKIDTQLELLIKERDELLSALRKMGINPDNLNYYLSEIQNNIKQLFDKIEELSKKLGENNGH